MIRAGGSQRAYAGPPPQIQAWRFTASLPQVLRLPPPSTGSRSSVAAMCARRKVAFLYRSFVVAEHERPKHRSDVQAYTAKREAVDGTHSLTTPYLPDTLAAVARVHSIHRLSSRGAPLAADLIPHPRAVRRKHEDPRPSDTMLPKDGDRMQDGVIELLETRVRLVMLRDSPLGSDLVDHDFIRRNLPRHYHLTVLWSANSPLVCVAQKGNNFRSRFLVSIPCTSCRGHRTAPSSSSPIKASSRNYLSTPHLPIDLEAQLAPEQVTNELCRRPRRDSASASGSNDRSCTHVLVAIPRHSHPRSLR